MAPGMNCQHCGKRLALLRRLNKGQFCTPEHRDAYQIEQQGLAVQRLLESRWPDKKPLTAKAEPSFVAVAEEEFLPEPPALIMSGRELPVFLNAAPVPRRIVDYCMRFEDLIPAIVTPILPGALKLKRRYAIAGNQIPPVYAMSPAKLSTHAKYALRVEPRIPDICRPERRVTVNGRNTPARIESLVNLNCLLPFQLKNCAQDSGIIVEPRLNGAVPQMPRLSGQTKWLPAIAEFQSDLPLGSPVAMVPLQAYDLIAEMESPQALAASFGISLPGLSEYRAKDRFPPCSGSIGWLEPMDVWREGQAQHGGRILWPAPVSMLSPRRKTGEQVHSDSFMAGDQLFKPRFSPRKRRTAPDHCTQLISAYAMPGIRPPAAVDCPCSIQQLGPVNAVLTQQMQAQGALKNTFRLSEAVNLLKIASYALSPAMERAMPIGCVPEEFHTWLDVPLFEVGQPAKRGAFAKLSGKSGLDRILANPRQAATGRWDDLLPSFCGLTPLLLNSRLKTIRPLSLTRNRQYADELEEKLRNGLTSKFTMKGVRLWRMPPLDRKWIALGVTCGVAIVFLAFSQQRHPVTAKTESPITQQLAQTGVPISLPIRQAAARTEPVNTRPLRAVEEPRELDPEPRMLAPIRNFFDRRIQNLKLNLAERARIDLTDDFRSGFTAWEGAGDWARTWKYDRIGLLRPGQLALYGPSKGLNDYTFEFSATAGHGSIGWVFRASDLKNYYGMRLQMSRSGAGAQASLERWIVAGGRERLRKFIPVRMPAWEGDMSHVKVAVEGSSFITSVNGQIADTWTDTQIDSGGVGFFNEKGGDARIHKMSVSHQTDILGKLCAMLTPHDLILKQQSGKERKFR